MTRHSVFVTLSLVAGWLLTWIVYQPGVSGAFLLDDFHTLEKIGALGRIDDWELFRAYVFSGSSGPMGRPISLASFLLNANHWPADPAPFKSTNILLHLLVGVVLFPTIRQLLYAIGRPPREADWIALLASSLWLLNPFLVSTTLYVVQRMTQLSAVFVILGIWGYLRGRHWLPARTALGYATISFAVAIGTALAIFSKENGVLLPVMVLAIEVALRFHWSTPGPSWHWKATCLALPTLFLIAYLASRLSGLDDPIPGRSFSLHDRLLTEPRIIWGYLYHLLIPHIQTGGLYQDGLTISTDLTIPWTTLPALLGLVTIAAGAWLARRQWPLVSLAIIFFLSGHLLESTTIPLELYFEHRNYLPSTLLFVPIAAGIVASYRHFKPAPVASMAVVLVGSYAFATWQAASLWGNEARLLLVWAEANPRSPRAQTSAANVWARMGYRDHALRILESASLEMPNSVLLTATILATKADMEILSATEFSDGAERLRRQPYDAEMLDALKYLVDSINSRTPSAEHTAIMMSLLAGLRDDLQARIPDVRPYTFYLQGSLMAGQGDGTAAYAYLREALISYGSIESGLKFVGILATHGHSSEALDILEQCEDVLNTQTDGDLRRQRSTYEEEIVRLRASLNYDIIRNARQ